GWPRSLRSRGCSRYWSRFTSNGRGGAAGRGKRSRRSSVSADRPSIKSMATPRSEGSDPANKGGGRSRCWRTSSRRCSSRHRSRSGTGILISAPSTRCSVCYGRATPGRCVLRSRGLTAEAVEAELGRLEAENVLPRRDGGRELLRDLGIDVEEVVARLDRSFGRAAVDDATCRVTRRPWWRRTRRRVMSLAKPVLLKR